MTTDNDPLSKANRRLLNTLLERVEALEAKNEQLQTRVSELESLLDYSQLDYDQMTRQDKERAIRDYLVEQAEASPTGKAAIDYNGIRALFNGKIATGYAYRLLEELGDDAGFNFERFDDGRNNRLTVSLAGNEKPAILSGKKRSRSEGG